MRRSFGFNLIRARIELSKITKGQTMDSRHSLIVFEDRIFSELGIYLGERGNEKSYGFYRVIDWWEDEITAVRNLSLHEAAVYIAKSRKGARGIKPRIKENRYKENAVLR